MSPDYIKYLKRMNSIKVTGGIGINGLDDLPMIYNILGSLYGYNPAYINRHPNPRY